jgi:diaminopimelate decarboxylase
MRDFDSRDGTMIFGGLPVTEIADRFGTPVYATDEQRLRENYRNIYGAFAKHIDTKIHYACKANTNLAILTILAKEGSGIDAVSVGEVKTCLKAGFRPESIMYTGVNVSDAELKAVTDLGVMINLDSFSELERLAKINKTLPISFRVTPNVGSGHSAKVITGSEGSKFGIPKEKIVSAYRRAKELGFRTTGIHAHIGSGGQAVEPFTDSLEVLIKIVNQLKSEGIDLDFIDMGGGIGVPYKANEDEMDLEDLALNLVDLVKEETDIKTLILEPGRYIICDATVLLTRCVDVKDASAIKESPVSNRNTMRSQLEL